MSRVNYRVRSLTAKCTARKVESNIRVYANGTTGDKADPIERLRSRTVLAGEAKDSAILRQNARVERFARETKRRFTYHTTHGTGPLSVVTRAA